MTAMREGEWVVSGGHAGKGEGLDGMNVKGEIERGAVHALFMRCAVMLQATSLIQHRRSLATHLLVRWPGACWVRVFTCTGADKRLSPHVRNLHRPNARDNL